MLSVLDNLMQNILAGYDYSRTGVLVGEKRYATASVEFKFLSIQLTTAVLLTKEWSG